MGIDMHVMIEIKHGEGKWHPLRDENIAYEAPRNTVLFSMLADVGNQSGRWERTWQEPQERTMPSGETVEVPGWWYDPDDGGHDPIVPIAPPLGVPEDASLAWRANVAMWEAQRDGQVICTYFSVDEMLHGGDWDQMVYRHGVITEEEYLDYKEKGALPQMWAAMAGGPGSRTVTEVEYEAGIRGEKTTSVDLRWTAGTVRECCKEFLELLADLDVLNTLKPSSSLRFMLLFES